MAQDTRRVPGRDGEGEPLTPEQARRLRADRRLRLAIGVTAIVLAVVAVIAGALLAQHQHPDRPTRWALVLGIAAGVVVPLAAVLALGLWWRARHQPTRRYLLSGDRRARARVGKQLRKGQPVAEQDLEKARAVVDLTQRQRWLSPYFLGMGVLWAITGVLGTHSTSPQPMLLSAVHLVMPPFMLFTAVVLFVSRRRLLSNASRQGIVPGGADRGSRRP